MALYPYIYTKVIISDQLTLEIQNTSIGSLLSYIDTVDNQVTLYFTNNLIQSDIDILSSTITNHIPTIPVTPTASTTSYASYNNISNSSVIVVSSEQNLILFQHLDLDGRIDLDGRLIEGM